MNTNAELQPKPDGRSLQGFFACLLKTVNFITFPNTLSETPIHLVQLVTNSHSYNWQNRRQPNKPEEIPYLLVI